MANKFKVQNQPEITPRSVPCVLISLDNLILTAASVFLLLTQQGEPLLNNESLLSDYYSMFVPSW